MKILNNHGMITIGYDYNDICMMRLWGVIILKQLEIVVWALIAWAKERLKKWFPKLCVESLNNFVNGFYENSVRILKIK